MKRRIFLYNTIVVIVALAALLVVSGVVIRRVSQYYAGWPVSVKESHAPQVEELLEGWDPGSDSWSQLDQTLNELGYHLYVTRGEREIFSSLDRLQTNLLWENRGVTWTQEGTVCVWGGGALAVGVVLGDYTVVAMTLPDMPELFGQPRIQTEAVMISLLIIGTAAIVVIAALSMVSTHFQIRYVLRPVNALTRAAQRVEQGDFSQPVGYTGHDEFTTVCAAFEQMQRHLLLEQEKNAAYEKARTDLVAGISHDLRTPLTSVKGYIKGLRDGVANTPEKQEQYLDVAYRKACDMDVLLQRLFYFSKLETGNLPLFPVHADLGDFVRGFVRDTAGELEQKGGRILLRGGPAPHPVRIDTEQMYRVLANLTENALRYAGAQPLIITLTVWRERDMERLRFADNGRGVPQEDLPHLFEQFWRGDQSRGNRGGEGSGLGLYIVRYIVQAHGGTITAKNEGGLVFEIGLPCEEDRPGAKDTDCGG